MSKPILFLCLFVGIIGISEVAAADLVTFPYQDNPCTCVLLTCTCCTGVQVSQIGFSKKVCVVLTVKILTLQIGVTINLDNKTLSQFTFSATNPPMYCIPVVLPIKVSMCLKIHDIKLLSLTSIQICMTMYAGYNGSNVFVVPFNCVKVAAGSMTYFTTSSTTSTTTSTTTKKPQAG